MTNKTKNSNMLSKVTKYKFSQEILCGSSYLHYYWELSSGRSQTYDTINQDFLPIYSIGNYKKITIINVKH